MNDFLHMAVLLDLLSLTQIFLRRLHKVPDSWVNCSEVATQSLSTQSLSTQSLPTQPLVTQKIDPKFLVNLAYLLDH